MIQSADSFLQGSESLASADLAANGRMLVACTTSGVKLFRLRPKPRDILKVSKVEIPSDIGKIGARMVGFSPDGKWLLIIRANSRVQVCRLREGESVKKRVLIERKSIDLKRLSRNPVKTKLPYGSLGNYERSINRVAFSADSRVLVVGDLSGYLDSWVLEGHEDLTQDADEDVEAMEPSSSSDDSDADKENRPQVVLGQHWIRNPAASLMPKLSAAALILSFRPSQERSTKLTKGPIAVHPTRKTPHPHSHDLPDGEDRLFVFTCEHHMYEFNVLSGRLSDWSRSNPFSSLPRTFRAIRDRAMGLIWDICGTKERIWLYGNSWLWMFDLSIDFPIATEPGKQDEDPNVPPGPDGVNSLKRRREPDEAHFEAPNRNTGAGGKIPHSEISIGIGPKFRKMDGPETSNGRLISADLEQVLASDDDEHDTANQSTLLDLRRGSGENTIITDSMTEDHVAPDGEVAATRILAGSGISKTLPYWGTHIYRDILGIVLLGSESKEEDNEQIGPTLSSDDDDEPRGVEVALVERPIWAVDLPPRYHGNQEWDN